MAQHVSEEQRRASALQAARRMVSREERPGYRVHPVDGGWVIDALPWLVVTKGRRGDALGEARSAIAEWLEVATDAFDVE